MDGCINVMFMQPFLKKKKGMDRKMKDFLFKSPTKIVFGINKALKLDELLEPLGVSKVFIVTGKHVEKEMSFQNVIESLQTKGYACTVYSDTVADPPIDVCDAAADYLKQTECEAIIAIGGGSVIDTAKAMSMLVTNSGSVKEYLFGGTKSVEKKGLPLIAVPTTAGSGSEVSAASVITDEENDIKLSVTHEYLMPMYAVIDPVMQVGMPASLTASTGMDALTHALEAYVSLNANLMSDMYAEKAMRLIGKNLRTAVFQPSNIEARTNMALASTLAAVAFVNGGLGAVHGIAQAMGGIAHVPHGVANAMLLPHVLEVNVRGNIEKFSNIAEFLGEDTTGLSKRDAADLAIKAVSKLASDLRIPSSLQEVGVTPDMYDTIVKGTMEYRLLAVNPVKITEQDVYSILEKCV